MKKKFIVVCYSMLILSSAAFGQSDSVVFAKGLKSLQFSVADFIQLSSFQGSLISYRVFRSDKSATRIGITANGNHVNNNHKYTSIPVDTSKYERHDKFSEAHVSLYVLRQNYFKKSGILNMYYTLGMVTGFDHSYYNDRRQNYFYSRNMASIGPVASVGFEWMFYKNFTLSAEYMSEGRFSYGKEREQHGNYGQDTNYRRDATIDSYSFFSKGVLFGLSAFF